MSGQLQGSARTRVATLVAMMMLVHMAFTGGRIAFSLYALQLQASALQVGMIVSCLSIIPVVVSVHLGRWTDRVGVARPALISTTFSALGVALPVLHPSIAMLCAASMVLGTAFMLLHIAVNNAVGHAVTADTRTQAFTWLAVAFSVSSTFGPVVAGYAIDHVGYSSAFLVLAIFPLLPLLTMLVKPVPKDGAGRAVEPPADTHVLDLLRNRPLRAVFIASVLINVSWDMFTFMVPIHTSRIGFSASQVGLVMGSFGVATFVVRASIPWLVRRANEWQMLSMSLGIAALSYFLFPLTSLFGPLLAIAFVLGLGLGSAQPMVLSLIHRTAPAGRTGEAIGVRTSFLNLSQVLLPLAVGGMSAASGVVPAFWLLAVLVGCGSWFTKRQNLPLRD